ncbi:Conserved hypothetical protein [sediment metagenome]|uniref:Alpha/beta-hydrolase catalytic domain-containing protein n=1 Tax=sediment metagenome TaxID=749907 RepID=D9PMQ9_9ZZZZ
MMALDPTRRRLSPGMDGVLPHTRASVAQPSGTLLPATGRGEAAARFVLPVPTDLLKRPLRVYASLVSAPTMEARVDLAMRELERIGAFSRRNIFVGVPTGGGHVNPVTLELVERMVRGDVASVAIQYGNAPSILSIGKVDDARRMVTALLTRVRDRIACEHPDGGGPRVLLYGESLGGWASQSALDKAARQAERGNVHVDPLHALGVDRVAWVGIPGFSRFPARELGPGGMQAFASADQIRTLDPATRRQARAWALSHFSDPVHRADISLIWRRPVWLPKHGPNPVGVDPAERWRPVLTFIDTLQMAFSSANTERPGEFRADGHDYRTELPTLLRAAFGFEDVSDGELARMTEQARQSEVWIMSQTWK